MPSPSFMPGPWPAEATLVQRLRDLGFREQTIHGYSYRQKYAICRDYEQRETRKAAASPQLSLFTSEG